MIYTLSSRQWQVFRNDIPCFVGVIYPYSSSLHLLRIRVCQHLHCHGSKRFYFSLTFKQNSSFTENVLAVYEIQNKNII